MKQRFIENKGPFSLFRLSLFRTWKKSPSKNPLFRQLWTRDIWERYHYYDFRELNKIWASTSYAYRILPYPIMSDLIEIAVKSEIEDEIKGACRLLFELEFNGYEYRFALINMLEQSIDLLTEKRFTIIYENANLFNNGNLRNIMNKSDDEITSDSNYYKELYKRALIIKEKINTTPNII